MRTHGWSGRAPATDDEAIARILASANRAIDVVGSDLSIADVARDLGVTRQTVYRYFPSTEALLVATAVAEALPFMDSMAEHVAEIADPAEAVIEGIAHTLERLPHERYLGLLLAPGRAGAYSAGVTSDVARSFGRSIVERFNVDWASVGMGDDGIDELVEHMLRVVQSFVVDPGHPARQGRELREYLRRWVGPAITHYAEP